MVDLELCENITKLQKNVKFSIRREYKLENSTKQQSLFLQDSVVHFQENEDISLSVNLNNITKLDFIHLPEYLTLEVSKQDGKLLKFYYNLYETVPDVVAMQDKKNI